MSVLADALAAAAASGFGCLLVARVAPVPCGPFEAHMGGRARRLLGRTVVVLTVVGVSVGLLGRSPEATTVGALVGWLVPSAWETVRIGKEMRSRAADGRDAGDGQR
ncbi:MAG: hypothetical protein Q9Q40_15265 [Acidobacteriota bacterium]|nr:hypothetical protein [Acidobacteriota bacterium]MDQ7088912.1 hypothetical protein [Acidobacteriota bacterium]